MMPLIYVLIHSTDEVGVLTSIEGGSVFVLLHTPRGFGEVCVSASDVTFQPSA